MTHEEAEAQAVRTAILFFAHGSEEDRVVRALEEEGLSNAEARKQHAFVQSAFSWALLKKMGVKAFPSHLHFVSENDSFAVPVASLHEFTAALSLAHYVLEHGYTNEISQDVFTAVISNSAEVNALNQALRQGAELSGAEIKTTFFGFERRAIGVAERLPWWRFWRR